MLINYKEDTFTFGKYKGEELCDVEDKKYLKWVLESGDLDTSDPVTEMFAVNVELRLSELQDGNE